MYTHIAKNKTKSNVNLSNETDMAVMSVSIMISECKTSVGVS